MPRNGTLDAVLEAPLSEELYGPASDELAESADLPRPEDLADELPKPPEEPVCRQVGRRVVAVSRA